MGDIASELILGRIADPNREPRTVYVPTELILRESTQI
jgi:DNA-binding LacI/PurR family transcriptional regulator